MSAGQVFIDPNTFQRSFAIAFLPETVVTSDGYGVGGRKLRIKSGATVTRILFDNNRAVGVEYLQV